MSEIRRFISQNARELSLEDLLRWTLRPGYLGETALGAEIDFPDGTQWIGVEGHAEHVDGEWQGNANHYCHLQVKSGRLRGFEYVYSVLWGQDSPAQKLYFALVEAMSGELGDASARTKRSTTFTWNGDTNGELRLSCEVDEDSGAHNFFLYASGEAPAGVQTRATGSLERPDEKRLLETLQSGCESYEDMLEVVAVSVGPAAPYDVQVAIRYLNPHLKESVEEDFTLAYEDPKMDLVGCIFEEIEARLPT